MYFKRVFTYEVLKKRSFISFLFLLLISCETRNNVIIVDEEENISTDIIDYSVERLLNLSGFKADWIVYRTDIEPYPSFSMNYDVFFSFPDKIKLIENSIDFKEEIIAVGSSEFHKRENHWEEYPRSELTDIPFQIEMLLMKHEYRYIGKIEQDDPVLVFSFLPNLPLIDPLERIITTGEILIRESDSLPLEISVYNPDSSLFWNMKFIEFENSQPIISPRLIPFNYIFDFNDPEDTSILLQRFRSLNFEDIKITKSGLYYNIKYRSTDDSDKFIDLITSRGHWDLRIGQWPDSSPEILSRDSILLQEMYGDNSFIDIIGGIPYRVVISQEIVEDVNNDFIENSGVVTDALGRIALRINISDRYFDDFKNILECNEGKLLMLYIDEELLAVNTIYLQHTNSFYFPWERENIFSIEVINTIINSGVYSSDVQIIRD